MMYGGRLYDRGGVGWVGGGGGGGGGWGGVGWGGWGWGGGGVGWGGGGGGGGGGVDMRFWKIDIYIFSILQIHTFLHHSEAIYDWIIMR